MYISRIGLLRPLRRLYIGPFGPATYQKLLRVSFQVVTGD